MTRRPRVRAPELVGRGWLNTAGPLSLADLRGRFDYASSSTLDIAQVKQFAILVISDEAGARVLTATPPAR